MPWRKYHTIWFVMAFGWVALYVVRMGISPVLGMIMEEFHISYATAGSLFSAIFLSYTSCRCRPDTSGIVSAGEKSSL